MDDQLDITQLPYESNIHIHVGNGYEWALVFNGIDVMTTTWTVTPPITVLTATPTTLVLTIPPSGPMRTRWTLRANGYAVVGGILLIDAAATDEGVADLEITMMPGPQGPPGPPGPPGEPGEDAEWWSGTQGEYNTLDTYDAETLYVITAP